MKFPFILTKETEIVKIDNKLFTFFWNDITKYVYLTRIYDDSFSISKRNDLRNTIGNFNIKDIQKIFQINFRKKS